MKSKTTMLQLVSFIFICCVMLIGCKGKGGGSTDSTVNSIDSKEATTNSPTDMVYKMFEADFLHSKAVPASCADKLILDYQHSQSGNNVINTFKKPYEIPLNGFRFDAADIDEIINNNASGKRPNEVSQVAFLFGHHNDRNRTGWHLVAYGIIEEYNAQTGLKLLDYVKAGSNNEPSIFDSEDMLLGPKKNPAEGLRKIYRDHVPITTYYNRKNTTLMGFSFTASQLNNIIRDEKPDQIAIDIGLEFPVVTDSTIKTWHLIAYGMKNGKPIDMSLSIGINPSSAKSTALPVHALYYDKADPCPPCKPPPTGN